MLDEQRNVSPALPQRRELQVHHSQPVEEVEPERAGRDRPLQIPVAGGDHAGVQRYVPRAPQPLHYPFLEHAEEPCLHLHRHLADLVEKQCPASGDLELSCVPAAPRAGEGAPFVPEQLALEQLPRDGGDVDAYERRSDAGSTVVDRLGEHLLAGAALARDEDGDVRLRDPPRDLQGFAERGIVADEIVEGVAGVRLDARPGRRFRAGEAAEGRHDAPVVGLGADDQFRMRNPHDLRKAGRIARDKREGERREPRNVAQAAAERVLAFDSQHAGRGVVDRADHALPVEDQHAVAKRRQRRGVAGGSFTDGSVRARPRERCARQRAVDRQLLQIARGQGGAGCRPDDQDQVAP